jgi:hypothetical protein
MSIHLTTGTYTGPQLIRLAIQALEDKHGAKKAFPLTIELLQIYEDLRAAEEQESEASLPEHIQVHYANSGNDLVLERITILKGEAA